MQDFIFTVLRNLYLSFIWVSNFPIVVKFVLTVGKMYLGVDI